MGNEHDKNGHTPEGDVIPVSPEANEEQVLMERLRAMRTKLGVTLTEALDLIEREIDRSIAEVTATTREGARRHTSEFVVPVENVPNLEDIASRLGVDVMELEDEIEFAQRAITPEVKYVRLNNERGEESLIRVMRCSVQPVKNQYGEFSLFKFEVDDKWKNYYVLTQRKGFDRETIMPTFEDKDELLVRIDSGCTCGMTFLDQSCDCRLQLHKAMQMITEKGEGMIIHIPGQDGRGMGHEFKAGTEILKDKGFTTVEAAVHLAKSGNIDGRTYSGSLAVANFLGVGRDTRYNFMTNNPNKLEIFEKNGHAITNTPVVVEHHPDAEVHLKAKEAHMGHKREGKLDRTNGTAKVS